MNEAVSFEARIEASPLDRAFVIVDTGFASKLTTHHSRTFEVAAIETPAGVESLTRDVPNVGESALAALDDRGIVRIGSEVSPGTLLVGRVTPRGGGPMSPEEKLLRAIFGEAAGDVLNTSLVAPPGCFGTVREVEVDAQQARARVLVEWTRPLDVGDVLELDGQSAVVSEIRSLGADLAWSGGAFTVAVKKIAMARDVLHARSIGPYDQLTQQPAIGRERFGGQVLEPEQVEILGSCAPWMLWEAMTIKSDHVSGRTRAYESLVKRENPARELIAAPPPRASTQPVANDIFSFFERPAAPPPGSVAALVPESINLIAAYLRALGFEAAFDAEEIGAALIDGARARSHSHGQVPEGELFSQKIFGPEKDYECECGKYQRMKHRGVVCEQCGVEVLQSRLRRERFGHIELVQPCVHPQLRDEVAALLGLPRRELDAMIANEGGRAVRERLAGLDLDAIDATETGPRAELALLLIEADLPATALMLDTIAVLPPDLRPVPSALNDLYARIIAARTSVAAQSAVDELFESLASAIDGVWRRQVFAKPVDYSGVAHLTADPSLAPGECRLPRSMITELFKPFVFGVLEERGYVTTIKSAKRMVDQGTPEAMRCAEEVSAGYPVLLASGPHLVTRKVQAWDQPAIAVDPDTARRLAARTVAVHLPITEQAALECSKMDDLPYRHLRYARGWLSRAMADLDLMTNVRAAALRKEREALEDAVLQCALGRPPPMPNEGELARWQDQRRAEQTALRGAHPDPSPAPGGAQNPALDRLVDELELSVASANTLAKLEIRTIAQLCQRTEADLLKSRGFGRKSLREIKEILAELGLSLGMKL